MSENHILAVIESTPFIIIADLNNSFAINPENVREGVLLADQKTRQDIREETKGKMVSIKMDCATRLNRSIYGINLQFIK